MVSKVRERLQLLIKTYKDVQQRRFVFNPDKPKFGLAKFEQLFPVDTDHEIKGYPCVAYNLMSDPVKFGIKVNPLENRYDEDKHPCRIEVTLLREFTKNCILTGASPHVTFYFTDMDVRNNKSAVTKFPLKYIRHDLHKISNVLVSEFVPGGSIEDYVQLVDPTVEQWRYIIFSMAWTLTVLQDKYRFMHNDFHYGNILVDNSIDEDEPSWLSYRLVFPDKHALSFLSRSCGIIPKIWDFEFGNVYKGMPLTNNSFVGHDDCMPVEFNPYYDLHFFLTSLLELSVPKDIEKFIMSIYPPELIPERVDDHESDCSTCSSASRYSSMSSISFDSNCAEKASSFEDHYYLTDESDESDCDSGTETESESESETESDTVSFSTSSQSSRHTGGRRGLKRTEFLHGDRMINGAHLKFKGLPTPLSLLSHEFFSCYRKQPTHKGPSRMSDIVCFEYALQNEVQDLT